MTHKDWILFLTFKKIYKMISKNLYSLFVNDQVERGYDVIKHSINRITDGWMLIITP